MSELDARIAQEQADIANAPAVPVRQLQPIKSERCSFCGQLTTNLVFFDRVHEQDRYKGDCCGGTPYRISQ